MPEVGRFGRFIPIKGDGREISRANKVKDELILNSTTEPLLTDPEAFSRKDVVEILRRGQDSGKISFYEDPVEALRRSITERQYTFLTRCDPTIKWVTVLGVFENYLKAVEAGRELEAQLLIDQDRKGLEKILNRNQARIKVERWMRNNTPKRVREFSA